MGGLPLGRIGRAAKIYVKTFVPPGAAGTATARLASGRRRCPSLAASCPSGDRTAKELYYLNPAGAMIAVPITVIGASLKRVHPSSSFRTHIHGGGVDAQQGSQYDVARTGVFSSTRNWTAPTRRSRYCRTGIPR